MNMDHHPPTPVVLTSSPAASARDHSAPPPATVSDGEQAALPLIRTLCQALDREAVAYCHWKSNDAIARSASGDNDLDFLISRAHAARFTEVLCHLGFKQVQAPPEKKMPGVLDYIGYDRTADRLIHVHTHYQLVLGDDMSKNYRLPIERAYLESAVNGGLFRLPAAEFEFIVFVIRMVLKHAAWDAILVGKGRLSAAEQRELRWLQARIRQDRVEDILRQHLPYVSAELFHGCVLALDPRCSTWNRAKIGQQLQCRLGANTRRPLPADTCLKLYRRVALALRRRIVKSRSRYRLERGGAMIALVGGDGAGKSTAADGLSVWLSQFFPVTKVHLGKPPLSWTTIAVRGVLKVGQLLGLYPVESSFRETLKQQSPVSPGYPWLLRETLRARDRHLIYKKARRFAAHGGISLLDRFPLPQVTLMDGPRTERFLNQLSDRPAAGQRLRPRRSSRFARWLVGREETYYRQASPPDVLVVLRVAPETAVQRKGEEDPAFVWERNQEIWDQDWEHTEVHVIDGGQSQTEVLAELKALLWSEL